MNNLTDERRINGRANNSYASDWFGTESHRIIDYVQRPRHYGLSLRKGFY